MSSILLERTLAPVLAGGLLVIPGWLLIHLLFEKERLLWKTVLGGGLGLAVLGWITLTLGFLPTKLKVQTVAWTIISVSILAFSHALKTRKLDLIRRSYLHIWQKRTVLKSLSPLAIFLCFLGLIPVVLPIAGARNDKGFSEFYIEESFQNEPPWRRIFNASELVPLTLVVRSHERYPAAFRIQVVTQGKTIKEFALSVLSPGESTRIQLIIPPRVQLSQRYDLHLYKNGTQETYRSLHLWIHAQPAR